MTDVAYELMRDNPLGYMWQKIDSVLPAEPKTWQKPGWVEVDLGRVAISTHFSRQRGSLASRTVTAILGRTKEERFGKAHRTFSVDTLPRDQAYLEATRESDMPRRLFVSDTTFTPIDPVDGQVAPIRFATVQFCIEATANNGHPQRTGIAIDMLHVGSDEPVSAVRTKTALPGAIEASEQVNGFLVANGFPRYGTYWDAYQSVELLDYVIDMALREQPDSPESLRKS